jgi:hypothetical protein
VVSLLILGLPKYFSLTQSSIDAIKTAAFFDRFTLVVVAENLMDNDMIALDSICVALDIPLVSVLSYGFFGFLRLQGGLHTVIESHPENVFDFRFNEPWEALNTYVNQFDFARMDAMASSHTPFVVHIIVAINQWKAAVDGDNLSMKAGCPRLARRRKKSSRLSGI